jgi:hypothetical protein
MNDQKLQQRQYEQQQEMLRQRKQKIPPPAKQRYRNCAMPQVDFSP